jgi:predicted RNA binding protein YcfA (HicA-like mRNA interferase family)
MAGKWPKFHFDNSDQLRKYLRNDRRLRLPEPAVETNRDKVVQRLKREGWVVRHGGDHDVLKHPVRAGRIVVPRHRTLSTGVARTIARCAGRRD